jgi:hypothetical protein
MEKLTQVMDDPKNPPSDQTRAELLRALQGVQSAMERLQSAKIN